MEQIKELQQEFTHRGNMYTQLQASKTMYLYEVSTPHEDKYYEVFKRKINSRFKCVSYPGNESFGIWAKCVNTKDRAYELFNMGQPLTQ